MKTSFSITLKLLLYILPLVCLPTVIVGYLSYDASVERVARLSREEQMLRAEAAANEINRIFQTSAMDLETITRLPMICEYYAERRSKEEMEVLLRDYVLRSQYYDEIQLFDHHGDELLSVRPGGKAEEPATHKGMVSLATVRWTSEKSINISEITYSPLHQGLVIYLSRQVLSPSLGLIGEVVITINFDKVIALVLEVKVGEQGYAFMVDRQGRTIAHPFYSPYEYNLSKYPDPRLREFVVNMLMGEAGWRTYYQMGEKAAAYAPIPAMNWSLAVTIPIEEFKKEANAIRQNVVQVVAATVLLTALVVGILSYNLLRPVRRLAAATERIASGDLSQEIAVKSSDELGLLTRSFNRMIRNLREIQNELVRSEKLISMGRLSAGVAHEIRNPLNAMKGAIIYLQRRKPGDPLIAEYTQLMLEEIERLDLFVTEFLYFAKQSAPKPVLTNLNEMIQNTLTLFDERLRQKMIKVTQNLDPALALVYLDPHQMEQVLLNLIINAIDAMPQGGELDVSSRLDGGVNSPKAVIRIRDNGIGIPENQLRSVFDPFYSTKEGGTGLGLPISLGIVESHGGDLRIQSMEGQGTEAVIELPAGPEMPPVEADFGQKNSDRG
jgi:two-component system, NtrC family, sensor kinase